MRRVSLRAIAILASSIALVLALAALPRPGNADSKRGPTRTLLAFNSMFGVDTPFLGNRNPVRGFNGDTEPWSIRNGTGTLDTSGNLGVLIKGLVFSDNADSTLIGKNDEDEFKAVVSCMTVADDGQTVTQSSVTTPGFHATSSGNATIRAQVELPDPCIEPVILIIGDQGEWLAVTGFDSLQNQNSVKRGGGSKNGGGNDHGGTPGAGTGGTTGGASGS
jgi:hypothetical protein